ncbi:9700_t:CDS:1, partial [Gigaspora margarita]
GNANLSEEMKLFSVLAQEKRQTFIKNTLLQETKTVWQAIPVTEQEAEILKNETTMKKEELISIINSILVLFPESQRLKYTNLKNKTKTMLLMILQEIYGLNDTEEALDEEYEGNKPANKEIA